MDASLSSLLAGIRQTKLEFPPMSTTGHHPGSFRLALEKIITADRQDELPTEVYCSRVNLGTMKRWKQPWGLGKQKL